MSTFCSFSLSSQTPDSLDFFPRHVGDVWQYRSQFTGQLIRTQYIDSVSVDSPSKTRIVSGRSVSGTTSLTREKIDTLNNVYNLNFQPSFVRYKLSADGGSSWQVGINDTVPTVATIINVYKANIFGKNTTVKAIKFVIQNPPPQIPFWIGTDHLAQGFGLIKTEIEPSDVYVLTGAIIQTVQYGIITSVDTKAERPNTFDLLTNYPNPFNGTTVISYTISTDTPVTITIYTLTGQAIRTLVNERKRSGSYDLYFKADDIASGAYLVALRTVSGALTHKILLMK